MRFASLALCLATFTGLPIASSLTAEPFQVSVQRFEVGVRALAWHEAELHQLAGRIVDKDQQRARLATLLEPAMIALAPESGLVKSPALRT